MTAPRAFRALLRHDIMMMLRSVYLMYLLLPLAAGAGKTGFTADRRRQ